MSTYKLTYFNGMGRAETTRMMCAYAAHAYEDVRLSFEDWPEFKPKTPYGQLPILEVDGVTYCQARAIELFIAKRLGLAGNTDVDQLYCHMLADCFEDLLKPVMTTFFAEDDKKKEVREGFCSDQLPELLQKVETLLSKHSSGLFLGDNISYPDIALYQILTQLPVYQYMTIDLTKSPKIAALCEKVGANQNIADWVAKRPKTTF